MIQNKEFASFEIKFHGEIICFLENPFKGMNIALVGNHLLNETMKKT